MKAAKFVKSAKEAIHDHGIRKGEPYWYWDFTVGKRKIRHYSKNRPRKSQTTQNKYLSRLYELQEQIEDISSDLATEKILPAEAPTELRATLYEIQTLLEETETIRNKLEASFPAGNRTLDLITRRCSELEKFCLAVDSCADKIDEILDAAPKRKSQKVKTQLREDVISEIGEILFPE